MSKKIKLVSVVGFVLVAMMAGVLLLLRVREQLRGNEPITIYGRIVDELGRPIEDAEIVYRIKYSESISLPVFMGRGERFKTVSTNTDRHGDYVLRGEYGYHVNLAAVQIDGVPLTSAMGIPASQETGWSLDIPSQAGGIPRQPAQRITYKFKRR